MANQVTAPTNDADAASTVTGLSAPVDLFADARLLIVDDSDANVLLLETILRSVGATCIEGMTDPRAAVDRCLAFRPDVVLLDLHMPHMDGFAVMNELRERLPADWFVPVVVLTADATPAARLRALEAGAKDFLTKPIDRLDVVLRIRNLLETCALYASAKTQKERLQLELAERRAEDQRRAEHRRVRTDLLNRVLAGEGLSMVFQPIVDLANGDVVGIEALSRFAHQPVRPPDEWFAEAKDLDLGERLELLAVSRALEVIEDAPGAWFLSINVSPDTAMCAEFAALLGATEGARVVIELTEHDHIPDYQRLQTALDRFRARGVRIAVDDAGAGYAGLQHILSLMPDVVKLDRQLIEGIDTDIARRSLARCLVDFGNEIGAAVLAEGVSRESELAALRDVGVTLGQGFYLGRPAAALPGGLGRVPSRSES